MATREVIRQKRGEELYELHEKLTIAVAQFVTGEDWWGALEFAPRHQSHSFRNTLLIFARHLDAYDAGGVPEPGPSYVAEYKRRQQTLGRQVAEGQPAYMIFAPVTGGFASSNPVDPALWLSLSRFEKPKPGEVARSRMVCAKPSHLRDVSQTSGDPVLERPMPTLLDGQAPEALRIVLAAWVETAGLTALRVEHGGSSAQGSNGLTDSANRAVAVRTNMDDAAELKTLAHELAYVKLHGPDRPDATVHRGIAEMETQSAALIIGAKAISSGNPLLLEHSTVQNEVSRLRRLERAHGRNENMLIHTRQRARGDAERAGADIRGLEAALPRVIDTSGDRFRMDITGDHYDSRVDAAHALARWAHNSDLKWAPLYGSRDYGTVGAISGFDIHIASRAGLGSLDIEVTLNGVPRSGFTLSRESFLEGGVGLIQRIENRASGIPGLLTHARDELADSQQIITEAEQRIEQPFRYASALNEAEEDLARIETQLSALEQGTDPAHVPDKAAPISVETVRSYQPNLGSRSASPSPSSDPFPRNNGVRHDDGPRMAL